MKDKMTTDEIIKAINKIPYPKEQKIRKEKREQFKKVFVGTHAEYIEGLKKIDSDSFYEHGKLHAECLKIEEAYYEKIKENFCLRYKISPKVCDFVWGEAYFYYHDFDIERVVAGFEDLMIFANRFVTCLKEEQVF